jgi:ligand-binding sensor domain-containing protein
MQKLLVGNNWNSINKDKEGNIWIANNFRGILKFDGISDEFEEINIAGRGRNRDGSSDILLTRAMVDNTGIFWFGSTTQGIMKYDASNEPFLHYSYNETDKSGLSSSAIFSLLDSQVYPGKIYVGTRGGGLNIFDQANRTFDQIKFNVINDQFGGSVRGITEDDDGSLWLGTWGDGLDQNEFKTIVKLNDTEMTQRTFNSLSDNRVRVL